MPTQAFDLCDSRRRTAPKLTSCSGNGLPRAFIPVCLLHLPVTNTIPVQIVANIYIATGEPGDPNIAHIVCYPHNLH